MQQTHVNSHARNGWKLTGNIHIDVVQVEYGPVKSPTLVKLHKNTTDTDLCTESANCGNICLSTFAQ